MPPYQSHARRAQSKRKLCCCALAPELERLSGQTRAAACGEPETRLWRDLAQRSGSPPSSRRKWKECARGRELLPPPTPLTDRG
jgi:hypothetical protein